MSAAVNDRADRQDSTDNPSDLMQKSTETDATVPRKQSSHNFSLLILPAAGDEADAATETVKSNLKQEQHTCSQVQKISISTPMLTVGALSLNSPQTPTAQPFLSLGARRRSAFEQRLAAQGKRAPQVGSLAESVSGEEYQPPATPLLINLSNLPTPLAASPDSSGKTNETAKAGFNCSRIRDWLWLGSDIVATLPASEEVDLTATQRRINELGIGYVINVADNCVDLTLLVNSGRLRINGYKYLGVRDLSSTMISQRFEEFIQTVDEFHSNNPNSSVYVHCKAGVSRSPTFMMAYMISRFRLTAEQAYEELKAVRPEINPLCEFILDLRNFSKTVHAA